MASPSGEKDWPPDPRKAIQELMVGKEFASRVESRLRECQADAETTALMDVVSGSITRALSSLDPFSDDQMKYEISGWKRKNCSLSGDKRGSYRKRTPPPKQVTSKTISDGYVWRKYGQKEIQSTVHPRSYYRCLHKSDQGCQAIRRIQKSEEDPSLFQITYIGEHTCKEPFSSLKEESLISFGSRAYNSIQDVPLLSSSFPSEVLLSTLATPGSSCSENSMMPNLGTYEGPLHGSQIMESSYDSGDINLGMYEGSTCGAQNMGSVSDHGDVTPGFQSSISSLDMGFMTDSFDCMDEMFSFDDGEFPFFKDGEGAPFF